MFWGLFYYRLLTEIVTHLLLSGPVRVRANARGASGSRVTLSIACMRLHSHTRRLDML